MIKWKVQAQKVNAELAALSTNSPRMARALMAFARVLRTRIQLTFRQAKSPAGVPWAPLNAFFRSGQPLRDTGRLYGSINARQDGTGVVIGTNLRTPGGKFNLGAIHQFGATVLPVVADKLGPIKTANKGLVFLKKAVIPARPFMPLDAAGAVALPPEWERSAIASMARALELEP